MKYAFLLGALLAWATLGMAQCGCGYLWLAMDDNRQYQYSYRIAEGGDTTVAELLGSATNKSFKRNSVAGRPHIHVKIPSYQTTSIQVYIIQVATHQKMQLTFESRGLDETHKLLFDFAPGSHYQLALDDLRHKTVDGPEELPSGFEVLATKKSRDGDSWLKLGRK